MATILWDGFQVDPDNPPLPKPGCYLIHNQINGKVYIGISQNLQRRIKAHAKEKQKRIGNALRKYGLENFLFWPLAYSIDDSTDWLPYYEAGMIKEFDSIKNGYNIIEAHGGVGPFGQYYNELLKKRMNEPDVMKKVLEARGKQFTPETRAKMSASAKARIRTAESEAIRIAAARTPEARKKNSEAKLGKPSAKKGKTYGPSEKGKESQQALGWITNGVEENRVDKTLPIPEGWWRGRLLASEETKSRMSQSHKGKPHGRRPAERIIDVFKRQAEVNWSNPERVAKMTRNRKGRKWITNGTESKTILPSEAIPDGWRLGRIMERNHSNE